MALVNEKDCMALQLKALDESRRLVLDTLADQRVEEDFVFSHFPTHGFKLREYDLLRTCVDQFGAAASRCIHCKVYMFRVDRNFASIALDIFLEISAYLSNEDFVRYMKNTASSSAAWTRNWERAFSLTVTTSLGCTW